MRDSHLIARVRRGLLLKGFDREYAARVAQELEEHRADLIAEGLRQGLSTADATVRAESALGEADAMVRDFSARLQSASWFARLPSSSFAAIALLGTLLWWALLTPLAAWGSGLILTERPPGTPPPLVAPFIIAVDWIRSTSYLAVPLLVCWIARRRHCGWKPALWGCLVVAIHNAMHSFSVSSENGIGTVTWGYTFSTGRGPDLLPILAPLAILAITVAWNCRDELRSFKTPPSST